MKPVLSEMDGIRITVLGIIRNKQFTCKRDCWANDDCSVKKKCSASQKKSVLCATEMTVNVLNASASSVSLRPGAWELIDSEGYAHSATTLCEELHPPRMVDPNNWSVSSGTQVKTVLVFPELDEGVDVAAILYVGNSRIMRFQISCFSSEVEELFHIREEMSLKQAMDKDYELRSLRIELDKLKKSVFSRFNNTLMPKECVSLDNSIKNSEFAIKDMLGKLEEWKRILFQKEFDETIATYYEKIGGIQSREEKRKSISQKVEQLYELSPREFEEWTANLFECLGCEKVTLTPQSNDKGVDVLAEKNGVRVAVQCKKYKGIVGSPEIQTFLGAMRNADADKGFYITTGTFSVEAEKIANGNPIELYDKISLCSLIEQAMNK